MSTMYSWFVNREPLTFGINRLSFSRVRAFVSTLGDAPFTYNDKLSLAFFSSTRKWLYGHVLPREKKIIIFFFLYACFFFFQVSFYYEEIQMFSQLTFLNLDFVDVISITSLVVKEWDVYFLHSKLDLCVWNWRLG